MENWNSLNLLGFKLINKILHLERENLRLVTNKWICI